MTSRLTLYHSQLDDIINTQCQSPRLNKAKHLSQWLESMHKLQEHLHDIHDRYSSRGATRERDNAENIWFRLMDGIPETLDQLSTSSKEDLCHQTPGLDYLLERVQFHITATELLSSYYRR